MNVCKQHVWYLVIFGSSFRNEAFTTVHPSFLKDTNLGSRCGACLFVAVDA